MYLDYEMYLINLRNNLIACGVEFPDGATQDLSDYSTLFHFGYKLQDILLYYKMLSVSGSEYMLRDFYLPIGDTYKNYIRGMFYKEFIDSVLPDYKSLVGDSIDDISLSSGFVFEDEEDSEMNSSSMGTFSYEEDGDASLDVVSSNVFLDIVNKVKSVSNIDVKEDIQYVSEGVILEDLIVNSSNISSEDDLNIYESSYSDYDEESSYNEGDDYSSLFSEDDEEYEENYESLFSSDEESPYVDDEEYPNDFEESPYGDEDDDFYEGEYEESPYVDDEDDYEDEEDYFVEESPYVDDEDEYEDEEDYFVEESPYVDDEDDYEESPYVDDEEDEYEEPFYEEESPYEDDEDYGEYEESPYEDDEDDYEEFAYEEESPYVDDEDDEDDYEEFAYEEESPYVDDEEDLSNEDESSDLVSSSSNNIKSSNTGGSCNEVKKDIDLGDELQDITNAVLTKIKRTAISFLNRKE